GNHLIGERQFDFQNGSGIERVIAQEIHATPRYVLNLGRPSKLLAAGLGLRNARPRGFRCLGIAHPKAVIFTLAHASALECSRGSRAKTQRRQGRVLCAFAALRERQWSLPWLMQMSLKL